MIFQQQQQQLTAWWQQLALPFSYVLLFSLRAADYSNAQAAMLSNSTYRAHERTEVNTIMLTADVTQLKMNCSAVHSYAGAKQRA